jgi:hypothetical protein
VRVCERERESVRERARERERERERGGWTEGKIERQQAEEKWGRKGCTHLRALLEPVKLIPRIVIVVTRVHLRRVGVLHFHLRTDRNVLRTHRQKRVKDAQTEMHAAPKTRERPRCSWHLCHSRVLGAACISNHSPLSFHPLPRCIQKTDT